MNAHLRKSRFLLATLTATGLAVGGWLAAPAEAATGENPAGHCCQTKPTSSCCEGAYCRTPAPNPVPPPSNALVTTNEGPQDVNLVASGFVAPRDKCPKPSASQACCLALSGAGCSSLTAQHVRLQI